MPANTKYELKMGAATREAFGQALVELGRSNPNVVVLDADLSKSTYTAGFQKEFPDRFFECGIAESNMAAVAAGLELPARRRPLRVDGAGALLADPACERRAARRAAGAVVRLRPQQRLPTPRHDGQP